MSIFYIVRENGYYQLRLSANHFCISAGDNVEDRLRVAERYLKKYKTKEGILKALHGLTYGCSVPASQVVLLTQKLKEGGGLFEEELKEIEKRCAEFNENNTPLKRTKRVLGKVLKNNTPPPKEENTVDITCAVKRPVLFKRTVLI